MKRIQLKKKYKIKKRNIIVITIVLAMLSISILIKKIGNELAPILLEYGENEIRRVATAVINKSIEKTIEEINIDNLFIVEKDQNSNINYFDFNTIKLNKMLTKITSNIQKHLQNIEKGIMDELELDSNLFYNQNRTKLTKGIIHEIPIGAISNNILISNIGPKIPLKLSLLGDMTSNIATTVKNYGINNAIIEISIEVELREKVILPFISKAIQINTKVPIGIKLIEGIVPNYYINGLNQNSPILTVPVE